MLQFLYVVLFEQSFDLSTDQEERASVEPPIAVDHLQDCWTWQRTAEGKQQTFRLVYFVQRLAKRNYEPKSVRVLSALGDTHTQILSDTIR